MSRFMRFSMAPIIAPFGVRPSGMARRSGRSASLLLPLPENGRGEESARTLHDETGLLHGRDLPAGTIRAAAKCTKTVWHPPRVKPLTRSQAVDTSSRSSLGRRILILWLHQRAFEDHVTRTRSSSGKGDVMQDGVTRSPLAQIAADEFQAGHVPTAKDGVSVLLYFVSQFFPS